MLVIEVIGVVSSSPRKLSDTVPHILGSLLLNKWQRFFFFLFFFSARHLSMLFFFFGFNLATVLT